MEKRQYKILIKTAVYIVLTLINGLLFLQTNMLGFFIAQISFFILGLSTLRKL